MTRKEITTADLRDTLLIWLFATGNGKTLDAIIGKTMSPDDLQAMLENQGCIRVGNANNKSTCKTVCAAILKKGNADKFTAIQGMLMSIPALFGTWGGSSVHPEPVELLSVFIPMIASEIRKSNRIASREGK